MRTIKLLIICILTACILAASCLVASADTAAEPIDFANPDFIRGMDVSSALSLEASGVNYYNADGVKEDLFKILAENGVNYIRVRVWNDPFNTDGKGYGGGDNNVEAACVIGERAARYGMKLLVDFHYSDFWADPGKQKAPKSWSSYTVEEKVNALYSFTLDSLNRIKNSGADIGMVQIGNETNNGIAGEYRRGDMAKLFSAGTAAVRAFDKNVLTAVHFTNPEKTDNIKSLADFLDEYKVDYDVFATSYYPYWHGSLTNLTDVLSYAADTYGKYVMVAETSYAYTQEDTDGHSNTVNYWNNNTGDNLLWDFTPQGQAQEVREVMAAVNNIGEKALGVFYWEGAWITVGDTTGLSGEEYQNRISANRQIWETFGSGWASSYASEYDPDDAGRWYGGSAVDNQAFFDANGRALPSLRIFSDVIPERVLLGDCDGDGEVTALDATILQRKLADIKIPSDITFNENAGDINGDGEADMMDVTLLLRHLSGMNVPYPIGQQIKSNT